MIPQQDDILIFKAIQERIKFYATGQGENLTLEETRTILGKLREMREIWRNLYGLTLKEANNLAGFTCER